MINYGRYQVKPATEKDFQYVWDNMREYDREELERQGFKGNQWKKFGSTECYAGLLKKEPLCVFGVSVRSGAMFFWLIATDGFESHEGIWFRSHKFAIEFIRSYQEKHFGKKALVAVWKEHDKSRRWLNRLGFRDTKFSYGKEKEIIVMEKK